MKYKAACLIAVLALSACVPAKQTPSPMPVVTPPPSVAPTAQENPGSLFDAGQSELLYTDNRARRVGDLVIVNVVETSSGKHKADTTSNKENSLNFGVENYFGKNVFNPVPFNLGGLATNTGATPIIKATSTSEFSATGETKRESDLTATVGARVVRVMPNGVLQIEGAREMRINGETQLIVLRGLVRTQDISSDNTISSDYLANAQIEYFGEGVLADKQKPGWLSRILDNAWPF